MDPSKDVGVCHPVKRQITAAAGKAPHVLFFSHTNFHN
jgi:hypothetical protein